MSTVTDIEKTLRRELGRPAPCILCGAVTRDRGVFQPNNPQEFGAPPGKVRLTIYPLCDLHPHNAETFDAVEEILLWRASGGRN